MMQIAGRIRRWVDRQRLRGHRVGLRLSSKKTVSLFVYHRITPDATLGWGPWRYATTPKTFDQHLATITEKYTAVSMDAVRDFVDCGGTLPNRAAVVTFDDGYRDNLTRALPLLERHDVPGTVYVSTALLDDHFGPLEYVLANAIRRGELSEDTLSSVSIDFPEVELDRVQRAYEKLRLATKWAGPSLKQRFRNAITEAGGVDPTPMLSREEVGRLAESTLVTIGSHGHDHYPLAALSRRSVRKNISESRSKLRAILEEPVVHFSYPYGGHNSVVRREVAEAGFETGVTTSPRVTTLESLHTERFVLPRIDGALNGP